MAKKTYVKDIEVEGGATKERVIEVGGIGGGEVYQEIEMSISRLADLKSAGTNVTITLSEKQKLGKGFRVNDGTGDVAIRPVSFSPAGLPYIYAFILEGWVQYMSLSFGSYYKAVFVYQPANGKYNLDQVIE